MAKPSSRSTIREILSTKFDVFRTNLSELVLRILLVLLLDYQIE